ncbi:hypothetical protein WA026_008878 [Henosepilachna vigintioctopunctata]|uniref:Uncharacterized protein n=1 Tax=Henosepilachna vigintioctopunctata TaxID=420089 RepID=A0AAW1VDL2_9CUCU
MLSSERNVMHGDPQGSILGARLFILYTSDLLCHIVSKRAFYAYDTKVYSNFEEEHGTIQADLNIKTEWCSDWLLPSNEKQFAVCLSYFLQ